MRLFDWTIGLLGKRKKRPYFVSSTNFLTDGILVRMATLKRIREELRRGGSA